MQDKTTGKQPNKLKDIDFLAWKIQRDKETQRWRSIEHAFNARAHQRSETKH